MSAYLRDMTDEEMKKQAEFDVADFNNQMSYNHDLTVWDYVENKYRSDDRKALKKMVDYIFDAF